MRWKFSLAALALPIIIGGAAQAATFVVNRFDDPAPLPAPNGCNTGGSCSLREAVLAANALPDLDTIQLDAGTYDLSIPEAGNPESGDLDVDFGVILQGQGPGVTVINGVQPALNDRILEASGSGGILTITGLTVQNGSAGAGGGIYIPSSGYLVTLSDCEITGNRAVSNGGGLYLSSSATIENCGIDGNTMDNGAGGGVYFSSGSGLVIRNSTVSSNTVTNVGTGGGLFFAAGGTLEATQSQFNGNTMDSGTGGGLFCSGGSPMVLNQVEASNNTLTNGGDGGGVLCSANSIFASNLTANANTVGSSSDGGGVYFSGGNITVSGLTVVGNQMPGGGSGGGAYISGGNITVDAATASGNSIQGGTAGGLFLAAGSVVLLNSTIDGNSAQFYGGILASGTTVTFTNVTVSGNSAEIDGGGVYAASGDSQFSNVTVVDNQADSDNNGSGSGGGIYVSGILTLRNSILAMNTANSGMGPDCTATLASDGYNIIGSDADCTITPPQGDPASTDLYGVAPALGGLADNGGPTQTRALLNGSPAIDGGDPAGCVDGNGSLVATDQRGQIRPSGPRCDIGAFELGSSDLEIVKTASAAQVETGDEFSYTLTITNNGPGKNFDIEVSDAVPTELTLLSAGSDQADCAAAGNTVTCTLAELDAGDSFVVEIVVAANEEGDVENTATVQGSEQDPDPANDSSSVVVSVGPANPDLSGGGCAVSPATPSRNAGWMALGAAALLALAWRTRRGRLAE